MDLLMGIRAGQEVFPHILKWLDDHDVAVGHPEYGRSLGQ
jgi:hypothetical protein